MKKLLLSIIVIFILVSCQKVVVLDLNIANPKVVIEGVVSNLNNGVFVNLSHTASYYDLGKSAPPITNAKVIISDNIGNHEILTETDSGHYVANTINGVPGRTYVLRVEIDNTVYEAQSIMKDIPVLDSVTFKETLYFDMYNQTFDTTYYAYTHFIDPNHTEDNYRVKLYKGSKNRLIKFFYLFEDEYISSDTIHFGAYGRYGNGDKARIELLNVDQEVYEYYYILDRSLNSNINSGSSISSAPENPPSNISNGALGYFGALAIAYVDTIAQ